MINADSEKRRKTLIRVHLSTSSEAERSVVECVVPEKRINRPCVKCHTQNLICRTAHSTLRTQHTSTYIYKSGERRRGMCLSWTPGGRRLMTGNQKGKFTHGRALRRLDLLKKISVRTEEDESQKVKRVEPY